MSSSVNIKDAQSKNFVAALVPDASRARVEIEEFLGDNDMTNLYLLALEAMMKEDPTKSAAQRNEDWWTFYSLAGKWCQSREIWKPLLLTDVKEYMVSQPSVGMRSRTL